MATPTTLPASFVAGAILTAAQQNSLRGAFRVLQVIQAQTATETNRTVATYADTTLTATITPSSTTSKVLVLVSQNGCFKTGDTQMNLKLFRGATDINTFGISLGLTSTAMANSFGNQSCIYLDSPSVITPVTYKTQFNNSGGIGSVTVQYSSTTSTITLFEISA